KISVPPFSRLFSSSVLVRPIATASDTAKPVVVTILGANRPRLFPRPMCFAITFSPESTATDKGRQMTANILPMHTQDACYCVLPYHPSCIMFGGGICCGWECVSETRMVGSALDLDSP
ncbi:hypothetical protein BD779DRAFT_1523938, partial [Infundibulicybe gibba]